MKTFKYTLLFIFGLFLVNSCLVDDETKYDLNDKGPNLAGFEQTSQTIAAVADGEEYQFKIRMKVVGPTSKNITNDISLTVAADPSSTAVEGTHYRIDNPTMTLSPSNNLLGLFTITMLTEGIETPLATSPKLILRVNSASGDPTIINNGKPITITMNYACPSFLEGTYTLTIDRVSTTGDPSQIIRTDEVITKIGVGTYRTTYVGHWTPAQLAPGTPGFTFTDVCGVITVQENYLADYWANWVAGTDFGSVDPETGNLYIEYSVCYAGACNYYKCTYVKQ